MKIKKGTLLLVKSSRKGNYKAEATENFDTEKDEWYPVKVAKGNGTVCGLNTKWNEGELIPCRKGICKIEKVEK